MAGIRNGAGRGSLGRRGEDLAAAELERRGMVVLERNWRCRLGEIDIVAYEVVDGRRTVVFCEVKCRSGLGYGDPLEAITYAKLRRLRQLAGEWLAQSGGDPEAVRADAVRLDAIGIVLTRGAAPQLSHIQGIDT